MRVPTPADFRALETWGLIEDSMAAIGDFSEEKANRRTDNDRHQRARKEYETSQPETFIADSQAYYRSMDRPIDRTKWSYLKRRKAWFHPPVGWDEFAAPGVSRILDLGCGDGDLTQRVAEHVAGSWQRAGYDGFPLEVVGVDLSDSRVGNARRHASSPHPKITLRFEQGDALAGLDYEDHFFDFVLLAGLLEVLDDDQAATALDETKRLTARGVYVRDMLESYPGITPRPELPSLLEKRGFCVEARHRVFEEPFVEEGTEDPLAIWPMNVNQVLFAQRPEPVPAVERY
jgi:SAM-dependent methyltransferase